MSQKCVEKEEIKVPQVVLAFNLLKCARITKDERLLVLTGIDYGQKDSLYEQTKKSLRKFKGIYILRC